MADEKVCHVRGNETAHRFGGVLAPSAGHNTVCSCGAVVVRRIGGFIEISTRSQRVLQGAGGD